MIYLSTWAISYAAPSFDDFDRYWPPWIQVVKPTFFESEQRVLVSITDDTCIAYDPHSPEAYGIFWMAGTSDLTPAQFMAKELAPSVNGPYYAIFDGLATFRDGQVFFQGRAIPPFTDLSEAIFMLVDKQIDAADVLVREAYPVVLDIHEPQ